MASSDLLPTQIDVESWLEYIMLLAKPINNLSKFPEIQKWWE